MKFEISHDSLAKQVFEKSSVEAKNRRKVQALVERGLERFRDRKVLLTQDDLDEIKFFQSSINFSEEEEKLIERSRKTISRRKRSRAIVVTGVILTLMALLGMSILSTCKVGAARLEIQHELDKSQADKFALQAQAKLNEGYYADALELAVHSNNYKSGRFDYEVPNANKKILSDAFYQFVGKEKPVKVKENFSNDGFRNTDLSLSDTLLVTEAGSNHISIFNLKKGQVKNGFSFKHPARQLLFITGDKLLRLGSNGEASILGDDKVILKSNDEKIDSLYYSTDFSKIVGVSGGLIFIWNNQGQLINTIKSVSNRVLPKNNSILYTIDSVLYKVNLNDGSESKTNISSSYLNFSNAYLSEDGNMAFIHSQDTGLLWNTSTGDTLNIPHEIPYSSRDRQYYLETVFSPYGNMFFTLRNTNPGSQANNYLITLRDNSGNPIESFNLCKYQAVWTKDKFIEDISFSPDGSQLACLCGETRGLIGNEIHSLAVRLLEKHFSFNEIPVADLVDFEEIRLEFLGDSRYLIRQNTIKGGGVVLLTGMDGKTKMIDRVSTGTISSDMVAIKRNSEKIITAKGEIFDFLGNPVAKLGLKATRLQKVKFHNEESDFFLTQTKSSAFVWTNRSIDNLAVIKKEEVVGFSRENEKLSLITSMGAGFNHRTILPGSIDLSTVAKPFLWRFQTATPGFNYILIDSVAGRGEYGNDYFFKAYYPQTKKFGPGSSPIPYYKIPDSYPDDEDLFITTKYQLSKGENHRATPHVGFDVNKIDKNDLTIKQIFTTQEHTILHNYDFDQAHYSFRQDGHELAVTCKKFSGEESFQGTPENKLFIIDLKSGEVKAEFNESGRPVYVDNGNKILIFGRSPMDQSDTLSKTISARIYSVGENLAEDLPNFTYADPNSTVHRLNEHLLLVFTLGLKTTVSEIRLWNTKSKKEIFSRTIESYDFAIDSSRTKLLITFGESNAIVRSLKNPTFKTVLHDDLIIKVAYSPTSNYFATAGNEGIIRLWDARSYELVGEYKADSDPRHLEFSPTGDLLVSISYANKMETWLTPEAIMDQLKSLKASEFVSSLRKQSR